MPARTIRRRRRRMIDDLRAWSWPSVLALVLTILAVVLGLVIWSIRRHRDPSLRIDCDAPIADLLPSVAGLAQGAVYEGSAVDRLQNGTFFDAMFEEIAAARSSIHFETFLWKEGALGTRLVE